MRVPVKTLPSWVLQRKWGGRSTGHCDGDGSFLYVLATSLVPQRRGNRKRDSKAPDGLDFNWKEGMSTQLAWAAGGRPGGGGGQQLVCESAPPNHHLDTSGRLQEAGGAQEASRGKAKAGLEVKSRVDGAVGGGGGLLCGWSTHGAGGCWGELRCVTQWGVGGQAGRWGVQPDQLRPTADQTGGDTSRPILDRRQPIVGENELTRWRGGPCHGRPPPGCSQVQREQRGLERGRRSQQGESHQCCCCIWLVQKDDSYGESLETGTTSGVVAEIELSRIASLVWPDLSRPAERGGLRAVQPPIGSLLTADRWSRESVWQKVETVDTDILETKDREEKIDVRPIYRWSFPDDRAGRSRWSWRSRRGGSARRAWTGDQALLTSWRRWGNEYDEEGFPPREAMLCCLLLFTATT